ncbi:putative Cytochrome P450 [Seiridium cardinale]|uniref:Cytochrome P450 n=1 Tax=Seiridium cardinale TaxID=138064 RepID=A0ABR2Y9X0_9PEZI
MIPRIPELGFEDELHDSLKNSKIQSPSKSAIFSSRTLMLLIMDVNVEHLWRSLSIRIAVGGVVALAVTSLMLISYRLWFHPLAKVPGPFLQRISGLPRIWQCRNGNRHICEIEAHRKYGSVVRIGPDSLSFSTLSALQTIHAKSANVFKGDEFYGLLDGGAEGGQSIQMTQDSEAHAARRRVLDRMMPSRERAFHIINDLAQQFQTTTWELASGNGGLVDINKVASWYGFDVISTIAFGRSMRMLHSDEFRWLPKCLQDASVFLYWGGFARSLQLFRRLLGSSWPSRLRMRYVLQAQRYQDLAERQVSVRASRMDGEKATGSEPDDIFGKLIKADLYSDIDLRADSSLLIAAGSDAVRFTIVATLYYWGRHADIYANVTREIRSIVADPEHITDATLSSLKYLRACIDETMRITPPKPSSVPREVNTGAIVVDGITIPAGMTVGTSTYALHRNPDIYPSPDKYRPERWLERPVDPRMLAAFNPFLKGPRACPGKMVAYLAMQAALFHLVYKYDILVKDAGNGGPMVSPGDNGSRGDEFPFHDWVIGYADGSTIELRARAL